MIFLTVGSALPFDRIVKLVDEAVKNGIIQDDVVAQIGAGQYVPEYMQSYDFLKKDKFLSMMDNASAIISHAGIGTISDCLSAKKPMLVMPRRKSFGELVDDHQINTARLFANGNHLMCFETLAELDTSIQALPNFIPTDRNPNRRGIANHISTFLNEISE